MEQEQTVSSQVEPVSPTPQVPKIKNSLVLIMSVLLIVTVAIAGLFYFQIQKLSKELSKYQVQASPTPLVSPKPSAEAETANWKTMTSNQFRFSLSYPPDWKYYNNANNDVLKLPYVRNFSSQNETLAKTNGCAIHFGFGGSSGPSNEIQSKNIVLDNITLNRKTWSIENNPVFMSYLYEGVSPAIKKFELLVAWISKEDSGLCQNEIDQILSTFKFIEALPSASLTPN